MSASKPPTIKAARTKNFTPYFTEDEAGQVRAAFQATGQLEGDSSLSDFIVRATMREVKRLQRKHNGGKAWTPVKAGELRQICS